MLALRFTTISMLLIQMQKRVEGYRIHCKQLRMLSVAGFESRPASTALDVVVLSRGGS